MGTRKKNVFVSYLNLLGVRYTDTFSGQYFNEHPHKYNLYGLSTMLSGYGIPNAATRIDDRENDLFNIKLPFVAHTGNDFVVVYKVESGKVHYIWNGKKIDIPVPQFIATRSGVILLAETSTGSGKPDYTAHWRKDMLTVAQQLILALADSDFGMAYTSLSLYGNLGITLLLFVNLTGIYICYLLVLKQLRIHSRYADKICSLFSKSDCNNVLESDAAKLWGVFGWSETGLGYFSVNTVLHYDLQRYTYPAVFTAFNNLFSCHQYTGAPLCRLERMVSKIQSTPVVSALPDRTGSVMDNICHQPDIRLYKYSGLPLSFSILNSQLIVAGCIYAIPVFTLNFLLPGLSEGNRAGQLRQEINSIKANEEMFRTLLTRQSFYEATSSDSQILFGNPDANLKITILTNPFCNPCSKMHKRVDNLLEETKGNVCIQYIFSSFSDNLAYANRYMNAIYLEKDNTTAMQLYNDWFEKGKVQQEAFFKDLQLDMSSPAIEAEFQKHESWKEKMQLRATPTILVIGYKLPDNYKIEDLRYFTEFDVDVK